MKLRRVILYICWYIPYYFRKITGTGTFGREGAEYIHDTTLADGNPLKMGLFKHHVKQFHEASCSVATVVSVINAIRDNDKSSPISQMDILEKVRTAHWKERMTDKGYKGRRGLPLTVLGEVVKDSLNVYDITYQTIETVQADKNTDQSKQIKDVLWNRLNDFENSGNCIIIAHFDQGMYVPAMNIPHISPIGGFDAKKGMVTILDVDFTQEKFYKVTFDRFYKGLSSDYNFLFRRFGFSSGGYVYIKLN